MIAVKQFDRTVGVLTSDLHSSIWAMRSQDVQHLLIVGFSFENDFALYCVKGYTSGLVRLPKDLL